MESKDYYNRRLYPYLSPLGAWALSIGTAIGWGSFVVTGNDYLLKAGPLGSVIAILLGMVAMLVIGVFVLSFIILMNNYNMMSDRARQSEAALGVAKDRANRDPLTGVKSKYAYVEAENMINQKIENGEMEDFAVAVFDVNDLKHINDTHGHQFGDEYIRLSCGIICQQFKRSPVYRVGGDEFAALLTGEDYENRQELGEEISKLSLQNNSSDDYRLPVIAMGIEEYRRGEDANIHSVFERADKKMYRNKKELKNTSVFKKD